MIQVELTEQEGKALAYLIANTYHSDMERDKNSIDALLPKLDHEWRENCRSGNMLADKILPFFKAEDGDGF